MTLTLVETTSGTEVAPGQVVKKLREVEDIMLRSSGGVKRVRRAREQLLDLIADRGRLDKWKSPDALVDWYAEGPY